MADNFEDLRRDLGKARVERDKAERDGASAREQRKRVEAKITELERSFDPKNGKHLEERQKLRKELLAADESLARHAGIRAESLAFESSILEQFGQFTDPRKGITRLSDTTPILLMPVRLETRFKTTTVRERTVSQLWVRVFPDDCSIDAFDPVLTDTEVQSAKAYWESHAKAQGDEELERVAFGRLGTKHGSGRAAFILQQFRPTNLADNPSPEDIVYPEVDTRQSAWAQAPKAVYLPDRFVFLGYRTEDDALPLVVLGRPIPSPLHVAPDPSAPDADQLKIDASGNLLVPEPLRWLSDFDRAVEVGMGFRIDLTSQEATEGFKRVLVVGLRVASDEDTAKQELETLLRHHAGSRTGLALVPQGTPTNNTEAARSGAGRLDDPEEAFDDRKAPLFSQESRWLDKRDGQWLAEYLGIDASVLHHVHHAGATDQSAARAMNIALWPATLGYWMESMMAPVFPASATERVRDWFQRFVIGGGACPAIRVGAQPYGILPATRLSRMAWIKQSSARAGAADVDEAAMDIGFLQRLYSILRAIDEDLEKRVPELSFVGKAADPHITLLDIVGLHPGSVEWSRRHAESLRTVYNRLNLLGLGGFFQALFLALARVQARAKLDRLGYDGDKSPPILDLFFNKDHGELKGGVVHELPLSETERLRASTTDDRNYIRYLIDAANTSIDAVYSQEGFNNDTPPRALLYLFLRHALQLGYHDTGVRLYVAHGLYDAERAAKAKLDDPFLHIRDNQEPSESRYEPLYAKAKQITGNDQMAVHRFIALNLASLEAARRLREQVSALEKLEREPTARLERAFADHMDCCAYRLDAWILGLCNYQLSLMRGLRDGSSKARKGIHLGAYAWLEDLKPENRALSFVTLRDPRLREKFEGDGQAPLMRDSSNQGYVHAPSLNHAVAAAVLRNGYLSNASPQNRQTLAVNLTSERVRTALALIQGVRAGQSLSDLLGYQFERGLHDRHSVAEVDKYIFHLRRAFPIRIDRLSETKRAEDEPKTVEAKNVVNGLALVEHVLSTNNKLYPFGKSSLPAVGSQADADAINAEVERLLDAHDSVADLALSEGVYQAVVGNYDRVASTYDAYARGDFPPEPDIARTPARGIGLTHRVGLHLQAGADPTVSPVPDRPGRPSVPMTPRAQGEPALNRWLAEVLPHPADIGCRVEIRVAATGADEVRDVTLEKLGLQPCDLLAIVGDDAEQAMTELDDRILFYAFADLGARPDIMPVIRYLERGAAPISVFECLPLVRHARKLTMKSRALTPTDVMLSNEARSVQDTQPFVDKARLDRVRATMQSLLVDLSGWKSSVDPLLADLTNRRADVLAAADGYVSAIAGLLGRAATFAVPQSGWGFAYDARQRVYSGILAQCAELVARWDAKKAEFTQKLALAGATSVVEEKFALLGEAERAISTSRTLPVLPTTPVSFESDLVNVKLPLFQAKRDAFDAIRLTKRTSVSLLLGDVRALLPIDAIDFQEFSLAKHEDELIRFVEDASSVAGVILAELDRRLAKSAALFTQALAATEPGPRAKALEEAARALLGADFRIIPEWSLSTDQGDELSKALATSQSGELFQYLTTPPEPGRSPVDFPVDTWMYGVARVRDKMHSWEQIVMYAGALGRPEPELSALQLPFQAGDRWLGLEFPPDKKLDTDRLLYTACFSVPFDKTARQCGLFLDEWTETLPTASIDTGIVFHHDRPNSEAPQTMLLVTPSEFRGAWEWDDLVGALHETLDFAKRRAIEPKHIDDSPYAPFLPATVVATQVSQLTIALELMLNNAIRLPNEE